MARPVYRALEQRMVFDGAMVDTVADLAAAADPAPAADEAASASSHQVDAVLSALAETLPAAQAKTSIIFIDGAVRDLGLIAAAIPHGAEVVVLETGRDGVEQIAQHMSGRTGIESIHILSHGEPGHLKLGNAIVSLASIAGEHADELAIVRSALSEHADILLYGCDVGADAKGRAFVEALAAATGADVAASDDDTGHADLGGDWDLEVRQGQIETGHIAATEWNGLLTLDSSPVAVVAESTSGHQSPPKIVTLADGRLLYVWSNNALSDDTTTMTIQGRIFHANGTPATNQFQIGTLAVDGTDGYDVDNLDVDVLTGGRVVVSWVRSFANAGGDEPVFTIINPSVAPGSPGFVVVQDVEMQQFDVTTWESPPTTVALADGRFIGIWYRNGLSEDLTSMVVRARIFNADGSPATNEFQIGTWAVDGFDGYDVANLTATQLAGGNVVVAWVRNTSNPGGDEPVFAIIDPSKNPGDAGFIVAQDVEMQQFDVTTYESPPVITALADGRFMSAWIRNGASDDLPSMEARGRIFNANGTPATGEFAIGSLAVDGADAYDLSNFSITQLSDGRVVVGFVQGTGSIPGQEHPYFTIIDPSLSPTDPGFTVVADRRINTDMLTETAYMGPPVIVAMPGAGGRFVAAWYNANAGDGRLMARMFDSSGRAISTEQQISTNLHNRVSGHDGFDWDNVALTAIDANTFAIGWVGINDGNGTGVYASIVEVVEPTPLTPELPGLINQHTSGHQSPPKIVTLADGRLLYVWSNNALSDDTTTMTIQGRIFHANGTPATNQFQIGTLAVDGTDGYDVDNLDVDVLTGGRVVVSWVRSFANAGGDEPVFTIINPSVAPGSPGFVVVQDVEMQQFDVTTWESPPTTVALADGRFIGIWYRNGLSEDLTSMVVRARIFNADGSPATNEFQIGTWAVDGFDGYDVANLTATQLAGGNVVVAWVRNTSNPGGDEPVFAIIDPSKNPGDAGFIVAQDVEMQQFDVTTYESPPVITALADGRFMSAWIRNGASDDLPSMEARGRIFNANGTPATGEFAIGSLAVDGADAYDLSNFSITQLSDGRVVVGFVQGTGSIPGQEHPYFTIIDPSLSPTDPGFTVVADRRINTDMLTETAYMGPPVIVAMPGAGGRFVAAWYNANAGDGHLMARMFDSSGRVLSEETLISTAEFNRVSGHDGFDWDNVSLIAVSPTKFVVGWVGVSDGSGTGVYSTIVSTGGASNSPPVVDLDGPLPVSDGTLPSTPPDNAWQVALYGGHFGVPGSINPNPTTESGAPGMPTLRGVGYAAAGSITFNDTNITTSENPRDSIIAAGFSYTANPINGDYVPSNGRWVIVMSRTLTQPATITVGAPGQYFDDHAELFVNGTRVDAIIGWYPSLPASEVISYNASAGDVVELRLTNVNGLGGFWVSLSTAEQVNDLHHQVTFTEGNAPVPVTLNTKADVADPDDNIASMSIAVGGLADGAAEVVTIGGASFALNANATQSVTVGGTTFEVAFTAGSGFAITKSGGGTMPQAALDTLIRSITYANTSENPTAGNRTLTFTATDAGGLSSAPAVSTITVVPVNDPPVDGDETVAVTEDSPVTGNLLANASDVEGDSLTVAGYTIAGQAGPFMVGTPYTIAGVGTLAINSNGAFSFTPAANYAGTVPAITYTVSDGNGGTDTSTLTLSMVPVNDAPVDGDETVSVTEDVPVSGNLLANASDVDGDSLTVTGFSIAGHAGPFAVGTPYTIAGVGTLTINANGSYTFAPAADYNGPVPAITYTVSDGNGGTDTSTLTLTVTPVNDAPVAQNDTATGTEDSAITGNVLANDSDVDGDTLSVTQFTIAGDATVYPAGRTAYISGVGAIVINSDGSFTFLPNHDYNGTPPIITVTVSDGNGGTATSTLALVVTPVNDRPTVDLNGATNPAIAVGDGTVAGTANEYLTLTTSDGQVANLTVSVSGSTTFRAFGPGQFTAFLEDSNGRITVTSDRPLVNLELFLGGLQDGNLFGNFTLVLADGTVVNNAEFSVLQGAGSFAGGGLGTNSLQYVTSGGNAHVRDLLDNGGPQAIGRITFPAISGLAALDPLKAVVSFSFEIIDGVGAGPAAFFAVRAGIPVINTVGTYVENGLPVSIGAAASIVDIDSPTLASATITLTNPQTGDRLLVNGSAAASGTLPSGIAWTRTDTSVTLTGNFTPAQYQAALALIAFENTTDTPNGTVIRNIPVVVNDGTASSTPAHAYITVVPVNDAPVAVADTRTTLEDAALHVGAASGLLANDTDVEGDSLTITGFSVAGDPTAYLPGQFAILDGIGTLLINANGSYSFTPATNYNGAVPTISYTISDGNGGTATGTFNIIVTPVNDAPSAVNDGPVAVTEDTPATGNVLSNDTDVDGDALSVTQFAIAGVGSFVAGTTATIPGVGTVVIHANGAYTFSPALNYNGPVPAVTYTVSDGTTTSTATLSFAAVAAVNDAPVAQNDLLSTNEDTPLSGSVFANNGAGADHDVDGDSVTVTRVASGSSVAVLAGLGNGTGVGVAVAGSAGGTFTIAANGAITFNPGSDFQDLDTGESRTTTVVYQIDDGNGGTSTAVVTVTVTGVTEPVTVGTMTQNPNGTLTVSGSGEPGASVVIAFPDGSTITVPVDGNGQFSATSATPQTSGSVTVTQTDSQSNVDLVTASFTDTNPPLAPAISSIGQNPNGTLTVTGTGEPGSTVTVTFPDGSTASVEVQPDGSYSVTSAMPQTTGPVTASQTDDAGNTSPTTTMGFTDSQAPLAPAISSIGQNPNGTLTVTGTGEPGSTVTVTFPDGSTASVEVAADGSYSVTSAMPQTSGTVTVAQTDDAGNTSPTTTMGFVDTDAPLAPAIASIGQNPNGTLTVTGTGEPGSTVTVTFPDGSTASVEVAADGSYSVTSAMPQTSGTVTVAQTDDAGNTSPTTTMGFTDSQAPLAPAISSIGQNPNGTLTVTGTGEPGSTVTVTFPDGSTASVEVQPDGSYSVTSAMPQTSGTVTVAQKDDAGNTSPSTSMGFVDTDAPLAPAISSIGQNPNGTLTVTGTGEPGSTVTVTFPDGSTASVEVAADGSYSVTSAMPQTTGPVTASQTDDAGNTSPTTTMGFTDSQAPLAPAISSIGQNPNGTLTVTGTGEPGSAVTVTFPDGSTASVEVAADGSYSVTSAMPQTTGSVTARQTDDAGNTSPTTTMGFTDSQAPLAPAISSIGQNPNGTLTVTGTGEPGSTVTVTFPDGSTASVEVAADGSYSVTSAMPQTTGPVTASQTDDAGNTSPTTTMGFTDSQAPLAPAISSIGQNPNGTLTVTGTGEPGSTVTVTFPDGSTASVEVAADGSYSVTSAMPQTTGSVTARQKDDAGNTSLATTMGFTDSQAPLAPAISSIGQNPNGTLTVTGTGEPGSTVTVTFPDGSTASVEVAADGSYSVTSAMPQTSGTVTVAQTDDAGNTSPTTTMGFTDSQAPLAPAISSIGQNPNGTLTVTGTGEPGSTVTVTFPDGSTASVEVQPDGSYSVTSAMPQTSGTVTVAQKDDAGNTSPSTSMGFVDTDAPLAPAISSIGQNPNGTLTVTGTGEPGSTVTVTFPDGSTASVEVAADGSYSVTSAMPQTTGPVTASQTDDAGNTSPTTTMGFTDSQAPLAPAISSIGQNPNGTLTVTGTGEPGSAVTVTFPDGSTASVEVAADGSYSVTSAMPQTTGSVTARQTDDAGNTSPTTTMGFTDSQAPLAPAISSIGQNPNGTLTVTGTGEPGSTVTVTFPDGSTASVEVAADGSYSVTSAMPQTTGPVTASQTDDAGNTSPTTTMGFTDSQAPLAPAISSIGQNPNGTLTVTGTGEPGSTVTVTFPDGSTASVEVAADGSYSVTSAMPQTTGSVTARQKDDAGNTSLATTMGFTDSQAPLAPAISSIGQNPNGTLTVTGTGEPGSTVTVTFPDGSTASVEVAADGSYSVTSAMPQTTGPVTARQKDDAGNTSPATVKGFVDTFAPHIPVSTPTHGEAHRSGGSWKPIEVIPSLLDSLNALSPLGGVGGLLASQNAVGTAVAWAGAADGGAGFDGRYGASTHELERQRIWKIASRLASLGFGHLVAGGIPDGLTGFFLRLDLASIETELADRHQLVVESLVRERTLIVQVSVALAPSDNRQVIEYRILPAEGVRLPSWLDKAGPDLLIGECPAGTERISLRIEMRYGDGSLETRYIVIETQSGDVQELASRRADVVVPFQSQFASWQPASEQAQDELAALLKAG